MKASKLFVVLLLAGPLLLAACLRPTPPPTGEPTGTPPDGGTPVAMPPTYTPVPTYTPAPTYTPVPTYTPAPTYTPKAASPQGLP